MRALKWVLPLVAAAALPGCDTPAPTWDLERMMNQAKYLPYQSSELFENGMAMRAPPAGVVAREAPDGSAVVLTGEDGGVYVSEIPLPLSRPMLEHGRERFEIFCAPCHGVRADGESAVGVRMELRKPPPLVGPGSSGLPPGRIYSIATRGYGLMRAYSEDVSLEDRWAIVGYLRALELSLAARMDALPQPLRERARKELE
jgi:hypothetical protein